ncbi:hypothetical protein CLAIMM_04746 [Cladophialophora immunda]|nr:hypothetical protein CLAIMM_04746 [Cladophialophora immunda]
MHSVHKMSVLLSAQTLGTPTSQVNINQIVLDQFVPAINKFKYIGCAHSDETLPAVILDAFQLRSGHSSDRSRCLDLLNCGHCATDLRVRVELANCAGICVHIEIETWQSLGGRESDNRDETEDAHFHFGYQRQEPFDINPPDRNLEEMFKEGEGVEREREDSSDESRRGQSWIQLWGWYYDTFTAQLCRYSGPCDGGGVSSRIPEQPLSLLYATH